MDVNQKAFSKIIGVHDRDIRRLRTEQGLFSSAKGNGVNRMMYPLEICVPEYIQFVKEKSDQGMAAFDREREQAEHERIKRKISTLKLRKLKGELHEAADVERFLTDMLIAFKGKLLDIPGKLTPLLVGEDDSNAITKLLEEEMYSALDALSEYDPAKIDGAENIEDLENIDDGEEDEE